MTDGIIRTPQEWKNLSIAALDEAMQHLIESRNILLRNQLLLDEIEESYKQAGAFMLKILKIHQRKEPKDD